MRRGVAFTQAGGFGITEKICGQLYAAGESGEEGRTRWLERRA